MGDLIMVFSMKQQNSTKVLKFFISARRTDGRGRAFLCPFDACPFGAIGDIKTVDEQRDLREMMLQHLAVSHQLQEMPT